MSDLNEQKRGALHIYTRNGLPLEDALLAYQELSAEASLSAVAMVYATNRCYFARLQTGGQLIDKDGYSPNLKYVYEARVFNDKAELRWWHTGSGTGDAALLMEEEQQLPSWRREKPVHVVGTIPQEYLLWGEGLPQESSNNWLKMATPRIGHYFAPVEFRNADQVRVKLNACEYLREDEKHGNVFVFEERWRSLTTSAQQEGEMKEANHE